MGSTQSLETSFVTRSLAGFAKDAYLLGFVLLWSRDEPDRVGEVAFMPGPVKAGTPVIFGRGDGIIEDTATPRLLWLRQQPNRVTLTGPLRSAYISRNQLEIQVSSPRSFTITNVGRGKLMVEGKEVQSATVSAGDIFELHKRVLIMCIERKPEFAMTNPPLPLHGFGEADEQGIVGESPVSWELREKVVFMAGRSPHVLIRGASGTGKELVARAIHKLSPRSEMEMVSRNAATFPEALIDAELFGNVRGFPQASMPDRPGLIGEANGSTLFLDEFAELPHSLQAHLLRVLDSGEYMRLGESLPRQSDFRLIAATNRPESALKEDVLARLRLRIEVPGLDQRREDIPLIARHLLRNLAESDPEIARRYFPDGDPTQSPRISLALTDYLVRYAYSTHVRELEAILWRAMTEKLGDTLDLWPDAKRTRIDSIEMPSAMLTSGEKIEASRADDKAAVLAVNEAAASAANEKVAASAEKKGAVAKSKLREGAGVDPMSIPPEVIQECLDRHDGQQEPVWRELGLSSRHVLARLVRKHGLTIRKRE